MIGIELQPNHRNSKTNNFQFDRSNYAGKTTSRHAQLGLNCQQMIHPRHAGIVSSQEALKYNQKEDFSHQQRRKSLNSNSSVEKKQITFDDVVQVLPIPKREEYSSRISSRLWSGSMEIHENAARNSVEFAAEGWDWRTVTEDEKMYICYATGERIHPVHYENGYLMD